MNAALDSANSSLQCVSTRLYPQQCKVDGELYSRLTSVEDIIVNSSDLLRESNNSLMDALGVINDNMDIIPTIQTQSATNNELIGRLNVSVQGLRQRMTTARIALASVSQPYE